MTQNSPAQRIHERLSQWKAELAEFVCQLAAMESPSLKPESQGPLLTLLAERLNGLGCRPERIPGKNTGGLVVGHGASDGRPIQLLVGHCDTVWPVGTIRDMPVVKNSEVIRGPGVYDMKAGLAQMIFALAALRDLGLEPTVAPVALINSDEEIGSVESEPHIRRLARKADRIFVLEPSLGRDGHLKTARKGVGQYKIRVKGRPAHAGLEPQAGASAILELSYLIQELFALNDPEKGITVNVGMVDGGQRANVVAADSRAVVDVRVRTTEDARALEKTILGLQPKTPGVRLQIRGGIGRPPLERTPRNRMLWELARRNAGRLGIQIEEGTAGGGSDGNTTSLYAATLDGLGAVGGGAHAFHEFVYLDKLVERTALLALLLLEPPLGGPAAGLAPASSSAHRSG